jgi:NADPH2:quinone reductase
LHEGAGVVDRTIPKFQVGDRIAFADLSANAEVAVPLHMLFLCRTASVSETAATILLQGLTAHYLATDSHKIQKRKQCLFMLLLEELANF